MSFATTLRKSLTGGAGGGIIKGGQVLAPGLLLFAVMTSAPTRAAFETVQDGGRGLSPHHRGEMAERRVTKASPERDHGDRWHENAFWMDRTAILKEF